MKEAANNMNEAAGGRRSGSGETPVSRMVTDRGFASAFWMTYPDHVEVFDLWRRVNGLQDHALGECVDRYCAGLPGGFAIRLVRGFLIDTVRW